MFNWIAGLIALLIVAAFFWPQSNKSPEQTINPFDDQKQHPSSHLETQIDRSNSFSKESDNRRVESFRETDLLDQKINTLLEEAKALIEKRSYTLPKERNAMLIYREILELSPNNVAATNGIETISDKLFDIGKRALANDKLVTANRSLQKLIDINHESAQTILLTSDIAIWHENKKFRDLLTQADRAFAAQNYIAPATKNALYFYEQTLLLDQSNKAARTGIKKVIDIYIQRTQSAIIQGDYSAASTNLEILIEIDPEYPLIPSLQDAITQAKQANEQTTDVDFSN